MPQEPEVFGDGLTEWEPGKPGSFEAPYRMRTLLYNHGQRRQIAWLDAPVWLPEGSVIELGNPNRDAVVIGTRLQLPPGTDVGTVLVDCNISEEFVPRDPVDRRFHELRYGGNGLRN